MRKIIRTRWIVVALLLCGIWRQLPADEPVAAAQPSGTITSPQSQLVLEFPLLDYPFNSSEGFTAPSMAQSLHITKNFYQYTHYQLVNWLEDRPVARNFSIIGFDLVSLWLPFGSAWLHEEWHRAVMSRRGIDSFNEIYEFPLFAETISVKHVSDADLIWLKQEYPAEMVRLHASGIEAQYELNFALEKDRFFLHTRVQDGVLLWLNYINNIGYLHACASDESNTITAEILQNEDTDISERDFTGLDCNAWVYDLFHPDEPYEARGIHPSGVGIQRYITYDDLTTAEQEYLETAFRLSWLNLVDPFLFGIESFTATQPLNRQPFQWNATLRHHLTSFGYSVDVNLFYQQNSVNALAILHHYFNENHFFPGLELALVRFPVDWFGRRLPLSVRTALWLQPEEQQFHTDNSEPGGIATLKLNFAASRSWETFIELEAKTQGWVAGSVYLEDNASLRLGVAAKPF